MTFDLEKTDESEEKDITLINEPEDDHHFRTFRRHSDSDIETPGSEHPIKLTNSSSASSTANSPTYDDEKEIGYFSPIPEFRTYRARRFSSRSMQSMRSVSGMSVRDIYGRMDSAEIELSRQKTKESILTQTVSRVYSENIVTNNGQDNIDKDGAEFKELDPELVTWEGPDDPENPRNWKLTRKWVTCFFVAMYTTVSPLSSSITATATPLISAEMHITSSIVQSLCTSIFILAWAICPLFMAPLSELYGRKIVLNASIVLLFVFNLACSFSRNTTELLLFRFLGGMAGAPPLSVGAGTLADLFNGEERSTPLALFSLGPTLGPIISPVMSGWILEYTNSWRWVFWTLTIMNGVIALLGLIFVEETYVPVLLARKTKKLIKKTGNPNLHTIFQMVNESLSHKILHAISRPITMLVTHPIIFGLGLYMAFMYGFMYLMLVTFPNLWTNDYHYSVGIAGTMYVGLGIGYLLGMVLWIPYTQRRYLALTAKNNGTPTPEFRIQLLPYLTVFLSAGLFWYGWSAEKTIAWIMPVIGIGLFGSALVPLFQCLQLYLIDMNTRYSASTVAAAAVFRSSFGFGFPLFGPYMYQQLGYGWSNTLCGIICLLLGIPFPIIVYRYGAKVRHWIDGKKIID